jgi:DNA-directed RNA polymerase specialized sigma24 family protein
VPDAENLPDEQATTAEDVLFMAERHAGLRAAFTDLPANWQQLLTLLTTDPPTPYAEISVKLGIPVGSIGPNRSRCLDRLRRHPALAVLIDAEAANAAGRPQL